MGGKMINKQAVLKYQMEVWDLGLLCNFYLVNDLKTANNSAVTETREKNKHGFGILTTLK
jgi:hypothetical protein